MDNNNILSEGHCIMVDVPNRDKILEFVNSLPDKHIYEEEGEDYGKENNPHITVMYGLADKEEARVKELLNKIPKNISATLGKISKFENTDTPYDVLKVEVHSPHLARIHEMIKKNFSNNYKWPQYNPHLTLAYVKKGTCNEYVGSKIFEGIKFKFENFTYSNGIREQNHKVNMNEYNVGTSGGYGGGAMAGGPTAPVNWAGTPSGPQTSRRLQNYPATRRYTYMQGNTVIGSSLYDTITPDDLKDDRFGEDEIFAGLRWEMKHMEYPSKDVARPVVIKNLEKNPKYYSDLDMYFKSDKQGNIMENIDPKEIEMGTKHEHEHTKDDALARKIAMDHLKEDPKYYSKLKAAGLEECGDMGDVDDLGEPSVVSITLAAPASVDQRQTPLKTSGLGKGASTNLKPTNLTAPETKVINNKNTVAVTKTPPVTHTADPLNHFASQIQAGINEKW